MPEETDRKANVNETKDNEKVEATDEDNYEYEEDINLGSEITVGATTPVTTISKPTSSEVVKTKREEGEYREHPSGKTENDGIGELSIAFHSIVRHQVTAYITWPETLESCKVSVPTVLGYQLRYRVEFSEENNIRNLTSNFALLDGLQPNTKYQYQMRYALADGKVTSWSQEMVLSTRFSFV